MVRDFDDNEFPLAYLITFRCYGTWLHGDERGSFRRTKNASKRWIAPKPGLKVAERRQLKYEPITLNAKQRQVVDKAIRGVCLHRKYYLRAASVTTNHAHTVVSAAGKPEPILDAFKSYATRALREAGLLSIGFKPWARHGSPIYLLLNQQGGRVGGPIWIPKIFDGRKRDRVGKYFAGDGRIW